MLRCVYCNALYHNIERKSTLVAKKVTKIKKGHFRPVASLKFGDFMILLQNFPIQFFICMSNYVYPGKMEIDLLADSDPRFDLPFN